MLKSELICELQKKNNTLSANDCEIICDLFFKKIINELNNNNNIELRGFGTFSKKINKAKMVRNPKTNDKIFKEKNYKVHFKLGKVLHKIINTNHQDNE
tara:strand:+ start:310 stop:606 length:297 start_codon:yes stop_codon:yes gene_type:complete